MTSLGKLFVAASAAAFLSAAGAASAATFTVQAINDIPSWLDTGIDLQAGQTYDFTVNNPATLWSAGSDIPFPRTSTADGIDPAFYGQFSFGNLTANFGALVGEVGGQFFLIGTNATETGLSGDLKVGYWDSFYPDNSGSQSLSISAVPEPAAWAMMLVGFGGLGAAIRSNRRKDAVAAA
ncbi:MAG TPA: PEPxxWA-CTERM sorting domain-containing protein [Caulobacteraceae bacterium]|jgi:hypothetical protein|nr:PEPxxWA-CTERM sorting domain-containing protein [Caulobacteraceae bacterium]